MVARSALLTRDLAAERRIISQAREVALPWADERDLDPLLDRIGDARIVLLGEASHGTAEYYTWRAKISQRLISERGFSFVGVEGDWPDCYRVNRYVKHYPGSGTTAREVLEAYERWPTWMWANEEVVAFAEWLRARNAKASRAVGFYGLDVYSLWESLHVVIGYLQARDGAAAEAARRAFECFEPYEDDVQRYARATLWLDKSCQREVIDLLRAVREHIEQYPDDPEAAFNAEQNALVVRNAEEYYRIMTRGDAESWNVRDRHMTDTLARLLEHHGPRAKALVWAHNTHIGDARATDMWEAGMVNIGQLARQRFGPHAVVSIGFASHHGSVVAARRWEDPMEVMTVPPAAPGSWDDLLHHAGEENKLLLLDRSADFAEWQRPRGQRAIGVVYQSGLEQFGNYVPTILPRRYDALVYLDETEALHPLHVPRHEEHEVPETYPFAV
jgi:erythromycin esterase-like protein